MAEPAGVAATRWTYEWDGESAFVTIVCRDEITQRHYRLELPLHILPALRDGLRDIIAAHPENFPVTLVHRFK